LRSLFFYLLLLLPTTALAVPAIQPAMLPLGNGADATATGRRENRRVVIIVSPADVG
jgi:hypothetical protein